MSSDVWSFFRSQVRDVAALRNGTTVQSVSVRWARTDENVTSTALASVNGVSRRRRLKLPPESDGDEGESLHATVIATTAARAKARTYCIRSSRAGGAASRLPGP